MALIYGFIGQCDNSRECSTLPVTVCNITIFYLLSSKHKKDFGKKKMGLNIFFLIIINNALFLFIFRHAIGEEMK